MEVPNGKEHKNMLVADSGGSKAVWHQVINGKPLEKSFSTTGINAFFLDEEGIVEWIKTELLPQLADPKVTEIYYYGAGLCYPDNVRKLQVAFGKVFPGAHVDAFTDTEGAARSVCQKEKGIGCIIGTGSSACLYDGKSVVEDRSGLGYALGDEGSGSYFGKIVLRNYLYNMLPENLRQKFIEEFGEISRDEILENVYKKSFPSRYIGKFTTFYSKNRGDEWIEKTLEDGFGEFVRCSVVEFKDYKNLKVSFVGSMAFVFKDVLIKVLNKYGAQPGVFIQNPIEGLVTYHNTP